MCFMINCQSVVLNIPVDVYNHTNTEDFCTESKNPASIHTTIFTHSELKNHWICSNLALWSDQFRSGETPKFDSNSENTQMPNRNSAGERLSRNSCLRFADWTTCNMSIFAPRPDPITGRKPRFPGLRRNYRPPFQNWPLPKYPRYNICVAPAVYFVFFRLKKKENRALSPPTKLQRGASRMNESQLSLDYLASIKADIFFAYV